MADTPLVETINSATESVIEHPVTSSSSPIPPSGELVPQMSGLGSVCTCGATTGLTSGPFVYALGTIEARFPTAGVEKEFAQAAQDEETSHLTDRAVLYKLLKEHRYLAREVCWIFKVEGLETYILVPRGPDELNDLVEAVKPGAQATDRDIIIGVRGPMAPPTMCNGLMVPIVAVDRVYSFDIPGFIAAIPKPQGMEDKAFREAAQEVFDRIVQLADNVGADDHRALNYLAVRSSALYAKTTEMFNRDFFLSSVDVMPDRLSGVRRIVAVIFSYTNRKTDVPEKYFVRVDITEKYPYLITKLQPYYSH